MNQNIAKLVKFGRGGDSVHYSAGNYLSGYGNPDNPHAARLDKDHTIPDGTPAIDMREPCGRREGIHLSISGPMVNVDLEPGQVSRLGKITGIFADAVTQDPGNAFGALVNIHNAQQRAPNPTHYGSLDEVAIDIYLGLWRQVGARIGHYEAGQIIWDPIQEPEPEPPAPEQTALEI